MAGDFRFRQFSLSDSLSPMKIGTDAVLLGAWARVEDASRILDIGTGCGIIALMAAQRSSARITAIEIHDGAAVQALQNFGASPWQHRLDLRHTSLQTYIRENKETFDVILCNPPFFSGSLRSGQAGRDLARHDDQMKKDVLLVNVYKLLSAEGRLNLVLPFVQSEQYIADAASCGLFCLRRMDVRTRISKPFVRTLMEFGKSDAAFTHQELILRDEQGGYSTDYQKLTGEFHPQFKIE